MKRRQTIPLIAFVLSGLVLMPGCSLTDVPTASEETSTYAAKASSQTLVSWWPGDGNAADVQDGNDGTIHGGVSFVPGQVGLAFRFDGSKGTGVEIGDQANLESLPAITVETWVCTTDPKGDRPFISKHFSSKFGNTPSWVLRTYWKHDLGTVGFGVDTDRGQRITIGELESTTSIADGRFHHVAGTYDGNDLRLYIDGVLEASAPLTGTINNSTNEVFIGQYGSGSHPSLLEDRISFNGLIDEVKIYNRGLSASEIATIVANADSPARCDIVLVNVDIKPGSFPNSINLKSKGVIPVAVLGSTDLDVNDIDRSTLAFGPGGATPAHSALGHLEDVNEDGFTDLVSHYRTQETGLSPGDTEACVTGMTTGSIPFEGCDDVNIVGN